MQANSQVLELTDGDFATQVERGEGLNVVDFWAPWCGPCRMVAPVIEALAKDYAGRVRFVKVNVDEAPATAGAYGIRSIPTIGIFLNGEPVDGVVGALPRPQLEARIRRHLAEAA
jgi:thioredoxin 1